MICALSGEQAQEPVVSPRSGRVFERRLIETYVNANGTDPINDEPLAVEELVTVDENPAPFVKPTNLTSIPTLLSTFQNEWDALALEVFQLRKELAEAKKELSVALYYRDAAARVAAKAMKERDAARNALQELAGSIAKGEAVDGMDVDGEGDSTTTEGVPEDYSEKILSAQGELFQVHKQERKKHVAPQGELSAEASITTLKGLKGKVSSSGFLDTNIVVGTQSGSAVVYHTTDDKSEVIKVKGKLGAVSASTLSAEGAILAFQNGAVCTGGATLATLTEPQIAVFEHPGLESHIISVGQSGTISYLDKGKLVFQIKNDFEAVGASLHLDGVLIAVAEHGAVHVYELSTGKEAVAFESEEGTQAASVEFAPNGYWLAVGYPETVKIFDLRTASVAHQWAVSGTPGSLTFDKSATVLVSSVGESIVYNRYTKKTKTWGEATQPPFEVSGTVVDSYFADTNVLWLVLDNGKVQKCLFQ